MIANYFDQKMDKIKTSLEDFFLIKLSTMDKEFIDGDMPDQKFYSFGSRIVILTDYFSDNELELFFPKVIETQFGKRFVKYLKSTDGEICFLSDEGWVFVAEVV